uniref:Uncharacterized protein n=1 Tax=Rhizophora mucronata TaxID=61149 RepID=A0A2P2JYY0_RHIMU
MRSSKHPQTCQVTDDMVSFIFGLCRARGRCHLEALMHIMNMIDGFFDLASKGKKEESAGHVEAFLSSSVPAALVMLYVSGDSGNKACADCSMRHFLTTSYKTDIILVKVRILFFLLFIIIEDNLSQNCHIWLLGYGHSHDLAPFLRSFSCQIIDMLIYRS